jgi:lipoprotein-releasing system permease protein
MNFEYYIVRKFIQARKKRNFVSFITYIAITGIMIGTATLIIALTILGGFEKTITEKVIGFGSHIRVQGFQAQNFHNYRFEMEKIKNKIPEVIQISPFVGKEAMIKSRSGIDGVYVNGIDSENDFSNTRSQIIKGAFNLDVDPLTGLNKILIGNKLANKLKLDVGDKIIVLGVNGLPSPLNLPKIIQFQISGIYETGMSEYDDINVYISLSASQNLFQIGDAITGFNIKVSNPQFASEVSNKLMVIMGYPYYARTFFQIYRTLFTWVELQKKPIPIILGLIIAVATFNIIGTLLMVVMEKTNEIGILKAIGADSGKIIKIFIMEGVFIGIVGTILGNVLAFVLCWLQLNYRVLSLPSAIYYMDTVPIYMQWSQFILVSSISLALCICATLIPSYFASKLNPINSIRFS